MLKPSICFLSLKGTAKMTTLNPKTSAKLLLILASLIPAILVAGEGFAMSSPTLHSDQAVNSEPTLQFSEYTATKLQYFDMESQPSAKPFVRENGPSFVRSIKPFVRENGPSFVRRAQADGPNVPYAASPLSAVEIFAALQEQVDFG
ncbi:hypothetical protein GS597_11725 [Synechococcales cyanobacterium C]|uniref:Uncharacterized protein n=1 Tax=Petrachloros mirabilis ULC683 TaxID=2781853 RepID=A0A8K2A7Q5_9CYAN|nr:hypothetical protein [Petrachloros mirabilis]NCJ07161.1 hypothetical protein [Petrachloros mirabilis ULC683]